MRPILGGLLLALLAVTPARATVSGYVVDEDGKPLKGVRVRLQLDETQDQVQARLLSKNPIPPEAVAGETGENGAFQLDPKGHAVVDLILDAPGRQFLVQPVVNGEDAGTFVLRAAPVRRGRVTANGKGVANATVAIGGAIVVRTDAEGRYETPEPSLPTARIMVVHPDYSIVERPLRASARDEIQFDVALQAGTPLRGRVVDAKGAGVPGASIRAYGFVLTRSGEDGSFEIAHPPHDVRTLYAREGARAGSLVLAGAKPPHVIRLRPAVTLTGAVRNQKDETPVAGARVVVRPGTGDAPWLPASITDAKGNFSIDGLEPGDLRVSVTHPAFFSPGAEVRADEGARVNKVLSAMPYGRLSGMVTDDEKRPVAAARVSVAGGGGGSFSAPDGTFSLRLPQTVRGLNITASKQPFAMAAFGPLTLEPGESRGGVALRLGSAVAVELRLTDSGGVAIAGEPVMVMRRIDPEVRHARAPVECTRSELGECRSDAKGIVTLNVAAGPYDIFAGGRSTVRREIVDQELNTRVSPLTITLERGAVLEGRVVWADGSPAPLRGSVTTSSMPPSSAPVTDGTFSLLNVPAGKTSLTFESAAPSFLRTEPVEVTAPASGIVLKLPRLGRIEGRVVEDATDRAIKEFTISLVLQRQRGRLGPPRPFRSDDGKFEIEDVAPGEYELSATAPGFARTSQTLVTVDEGKTASASVALERAAALGGRVTAGGRPLPDVQVLAAGADTVTGFNRGFPTGRTDANGEYTIDGLAAGAHTIEFRREGYTSARVPASLTVGKETRVDAELSRGREIRGRVLDSAGRPVALAQIAMRNAEEITSQFSHTATDAGGVFRLSGLGETTYQILASKEGYVGAQASVNPATSGDITLTLERGASVSGRVIGLAPAELSFVDVRATSVSPGAMFSGMSSTQTDARGSFTLTGLADGEYTIVAARRNMRGREARSPRIRVQNGSAPPVEIDFNAGIAVRGRVTRQGRNVTQGLVSFMPAAVQSFDNSVRAEIQADGGYELRLPSPGEYRIIVNSFPSFAMFEAGKLTVSGEMTHDVDMRGATVGGRVTDAATGAPIAGATVYLSPGQEARTDASGRFSFDVVPDGKYTTRAARDGYAPSVRTFTVERGTAPELELALSRGESVEIRVTDAATGKPVSTRIFVMDGSAPVFNGELIPDANGAARIALPAGTFKAYLGFPPYVRHEATITVPGPPLAIALERGGTLRLTSVIAGTASVRVSRDGQTAVNAAMAFIGNETLKAGVYTLEALDAAGKVLARKDGVVVTQGQTTSVALE